EADRLEAKAVRYEGKASRYLGVSKAKRLEARAAKRREAAEDSFQRSDTDARRWSMNVERIEITDPEEDTALVFIREDDGSGTWRRTLFSKWSSLANRTAQIRTTGLSREAVLAELAQVL